MRREDKKFKIELKDKELYLIEDALKTVREIKIYGDGREAFQRKVDRVIQKLYSNAWN